MRSLSEIVSDNRKAAEQGHAVPGTAVGTAGVAIVKYNVFRTADHSQVNTGGPLTLAEVAQYRTQINSTEYKLVQVEGPSPRSAGGAHGRLTSGKASSKVQAQK